MYKILTKEEDVNGKVYFLRQTYCFSLSEAKMFIKKKGNRKWHYVIEHNGNITHECKQNCFAAREINKAVQGVYTN